MYTYILLRIVYTFFKISVKNIIHIIFYYLNTLLFEYLLILEIVLKFSFVLFWWTIESIIRTNFLLFEQNSYYLVLECSKNFFLSFY